MGKYLKLFNKLSDYETFKGGLDWITPNVSLILENGKQMRYNKRVVLPSKPNIPSTNLITFTIDGVEYQAEEGMTWGEWVESKYNTIQYTICPGDYIVSNIPVHSLQIQEQSGETHRIRPQKYDVIENNQIYVNTEYGEPCVCADNGSI